jgi:hypothetical protein
MNLMTLRLTPYKGEFAEADVLKALSGAKDLDMQPLFAGDGVQRGVNIELLNGYFQAPGEDVCPLVMMQTWVEQEISAQGGGRIHTDYMMSLYFLYYFGVPSNDFVAIQYVEQRRRHLTACMKAIEMQSGGNVSATIAVSPHWKWDTSRNTTFDYMTPFQYFGGAIVIPPASGYNCVRVDRPISVWH